MSYIGNTSTTQTYAAAIDTFNGDGTTTAFTLSRPVATVAQIEVVVNNVQQAPGSYTVSGNTLTFTGAPSSGTANIYVYYTSPVTQVIAPSTGTVGKSQLDIANFNGTGAMLLPSGTTAQRPSSPIAGEIRYNSTTGNPEWYDAAFSQWVNFADPRSYTVDILLVAGGGCGSGQNGGGAGAGGMFETSATAVGSSFYSIVIGAGGTGGGNGNNTTAFGNTAIGGGGGGNSGGSGGGYGGSTTSGAPGTAGQGNAGGGGVYNYGYYPAGGGGGKGAVGGNAPDPYTGGNGGAGAISTFSGSSVYYAGGGGGGVNPGTGGTGGVGGGGNGSTASYSPTPGTANSGGGGGGGNNNLAGTGGSGIVIIRYAGVQRGTGGTVTSVGGYTIHTFTTSGTFTA